jgi:transcriptional regulator with GAF, ATPase, and Fis domain
MKEKACQMIKKNLGLSLEEINFLAVLHAFGTPVSIDIAGSIAPIRPGPFLDLLGRGHKPQYICKTNGEYYFLKSDLPSWLTDRLEKINTPERIGELISRLSIENFMGDLNREDINNLITKIGDNKKKVAIEIELAQKALKENDNATAFNFFKSVVNRLYPISGDSHDKQHFISAVIELSKIWKVSGKTYYELTLYLKRALDISKSIGDKRSLAILNLILSGSLDLAGDRNRAWEAFSAGYKIVEELGDDDIRSRTAPALGRYFAYQGLIKDAVPHFERIFNTSQLDKDDIAAMDILSSPYPYGIYLAYLGEFHLAVGNLLYCSQKAKEQVEKGEEAIAKTILAIVLLMVKQIKPAAVLLESALKEAKKSDNTLLLYFTQGHIAYRYFLEGRIEKARKQLAEIIGFGEKRGVVRYINSPHIIEMLFEFEQSGYPPLPQISYKEEIRKVLEGINVHLQGVGHRLEAIAASIDNKPVSRIEDSLMQSKTCLEKAGDRVQLAKTLLEEARMKLGRKNKEESLNLIHKAYHYLEDYATIFFPEDLKPLLKLEKTRPSANDLMLNDNNKKLFNAYDSISLSENVADVHYNLLKNICSIIKAERAALFQLDINAKTIKPFSTARYNITQSEVDSNRFSDSIKLVKQAYESKNISINRPHDPSVVKNHFPVRAMCCIPVITDDEVSRVLYLDNIFLEDKYDLADGYLITKLVNQAEFRIRRILKLEKFKDERDILISGKTYQTDNIKDSELLFQNPDMVKTISQADKVAATDSTILISGETGTGKDLLARRIHRKSSRRDGPFVVVDLTGIPENLLESELFGYEKGAFTGADRRKKGRLELAHNGTLFLDEIGEIPFSFQVKLLRVLQEKKFMRVGGTNVLHSDFRLITATNRNLEQEARSGQFRQDLFFRLNVMPIVLPPLRTRGNDILLLARHFLDRFAIKYGRHKISLTKTDETWLSSYSWPGNVRELENVLERAVILSADGALNFPALTNSIQGAIETADFSHTNLDKSENKTYLPIDDSPSIDEVQRRYIKWVLKKTGGKISGPGGATEILKLKRSTLYSRMDRLGMRSSSS